MCVGVCVAHSICPPSLVRDWPTPPKDPHGTARARVNHFKQPTNQIIHQKTFTRMSAISENKSMDQAKQKPSPEAKGNLNSGCHCNLKGYKSINIGGPGNMDGLYLVSNPPLRGSGYESNNPSTHAHPSSQNLNPARGAMRLIHPQCGLAWYCKNTVRHSDGWVNVLEYITLLSPLQHSGARVLPASRLLKLKPLSDAAISQSFFPLPRFFAGGWCIVADILPILRLTLCQGPVNKSYWYYTYRLQYIDNRHI
ncbi:hypothetical protein DFH27DRAFT_565956 [Peziza echinospora]|nr:hypothetical protein DFH27DRAFT_565956 [Peziza echinospora]